jgi:hypothetical protein
MGSAIVNCNGVTLKALYSKFEKNAPFESGLRFKHLKNSGGQKSCKR